MATAVESAAPKPPKIRRFWRAVDMVPVQAGGYHVRLDERAVRTPQGTLLLIDGNKERLAHMVAGEWESQQTLLKPYSLPLTSLVVRSIDDFGDAATRKDAIDKLIKYLRTDAICFHSDFPEVLVQLQTKHWEPLIEWAKNKFGVDIRPAYGLLNSSQPQQTEDTLRQHIERYTPLKLAAFERATMTAKSFIVGLALVEGHISALEASRAARVELESQIQQWGEVEDSHDVDKEDLQRQMASVALVL
ncbi:ATP synthase mitochondrial F1 complex assembly factor 2 [Sorochytrium milnesiophthora]